MAKARVYSEETKAIISRFFSAFDACMSQGKIHSVTMFCKEHGIDRVNFYKARDTSSGRFQAGWLSHLVYLGVSPTWLLIGYGDMFKKKASLPNDAPQQLL